MKTFATSISIQADVDTIWALLTDAAGYPQWNTTVDKIVGDIADGKTITVHAKISPGRVFPLKVTAFEPPQTMTWAGGMPLSLFTGVRRFTLSPKGDGQVTFAMDEAYQGLLAPLIARSIPDLQPTFDTFAVDLKRRAENAP